MKGNKADEKEKTYLEAKSKKKNSEEIAELESLFVSLHIKNGWKGYGWKVAAARYNTLSDKYPEELKRIIRKHLGRNELRKFVEDNYGRRLFVTLQLDETKDDVEKLKEIVKWVKRGGKIENEDVEEILWIYEATNREMRENLETYLKYLQKIGQLVKHLSEVVENNLDVNYDEFFNPLGVTIKNPSH